MTDKRKRTFYTEPIGCTCRENPITAKVRGGMK
jgi:hypothetical protein